MNVKVRMQPCNNKRKYFNCDGDIPVQRLFTTLGSHLQFQWQPHNVISWNLHNPSPCPLLLDLLISLICCSKPHTPLPFYKTCTFMRPINGIVCTKTSQDGWSICESTPSRNNYRLGGCVYVDMARQDVSCLSMVKQCKHNAPSVRGRRTDCQGHWSQIGVYASILPSFITVGGNNAKLIIQPLKKQEKRNRFTPHWAEIRRHIWRVPVYEDKNTLIFPVLIYFGFIVIDREFVLVVKIEARKRLKNI